MKIYPIIAAILICSAAQQLLYPANLAVPKKKTGITKKEIDSWFKAAQEGDLKVISTLIDKIDLNITDIYGYTALLYASMHGHPDIVRLLVREPNINVNYQDKLGNSPLHLAVKHKHNSIVSELAYLSSIINVNIKNKKQLTPLHLACVMMNYTAINILFNALNIDINATDDNGNTPLMLLSIADFPKFIFSSLAIEGAHINFKLKNVDGKTLIDLAHKNADLMQILTSNLEELKLNIDDAIQTNNIANLKKFAERTEMNFSDRDGNTPLHKIFLKNSYEMALIVLQHAKDPQELLTALNKKKQTPLELINPTSELFNLCMDLAFGNKSIKAALCAACGKKSTNICAKCRAVYYCSRECQKSDWKRHKQTCCATHE